MNSKDLPQELKRRLSALDRIYTLYEEFIVSYDLACEKFCAACCTGNVTMTTMEGYYILSRMSREERQRLSQKVTEASGDRRFQPHLTINGIAQLCMDGMPVPDEPIDPAWGSCPLLKDAACSIYPLRPFGCRCMVSKKDCRQTGFADVEELVFAVNNLILQHIEHIDSRGATGNLVDTLLFFETPGNLQSYRNQGNMHAGTGLAPNRPVPVLMIPPELHRQVQPILQALRRLDQTGV
jgi:Fe-S-cluster containining protein